MPRSYVRGTVLMREPPDPTVSPLAVVRRILAKVCGRRGPFVADGAFGALLSRCLSLGLAMQKRELLYQIEDCASGALGAEPGHQLRSALVTDWVRTLAA